jgi:8-oxo-dGTP pyrophosphatase MutT (NUDIX family)
MGKSQSKIAPHTKALTSPYPLGGGKVGPFRLSVPPEYLRWDVEAPTYDPPEYNDPSILADPINGKPRPPWADPIDTTTINYDDPIHASLQGDILVHDEKDPVYNAVVARVPLNPCGRTGLRGRGLLGRWGPNKAADPIVTRFKGTEVDALGRRVVQFVAIKRRDNGQWAVPGGMVDPGELATFTLKREFGEEALASLEADDETRTRIKQQVDELFDLRREENRGGRLYMGYVDDPRNTDNAWMETTVQHVHRDQVELPLRAGDDAGAVCWMDIEDDMSHLYADHAKFVRIARARAWYLASHKKWYDAWYAGASADSRTPELSHFDPENFEKWEGPLF